MSLYFHIAYPWYLFYAVLILLSAVCIRYFWCFFSYYAYPLTTFLKQKKAQASSFYPRFFFWIRFVSLSLMALLIAKPQIVDSKSKVTVEGVDIILTLDMSESMKMFDDIQDQRSRWEVAKNEALRFVDKRENDAIGLVIFGRYAVTRCPLTHDKRVLKSIIENLEIGMPGCNMEHGTMLAQSIVSSARRLQKSKAKSKIIVLVTDGTPTEGDIPIQEAIDIAQKMHVKIYTIGVGGDQGGYVRDSIFGIRLVGNPLNKQLLNTIATVTGGAFFEAKKPKDLKNIYDKINQLEKVSYETEVYNKYLDYFLPLLWWTIVLVLFELFMATFVWFIF